MKGVSGGMFASEAAAALQITPTVFAIEVASGALPEPSGYSCGGLPMWSGRSIGEAVRKRLGPLDLRGLGDALKRTNDSGEGDA